MAKNIPKTFNFCSESLCEGIPEKEKAIIKNVNKILKYSTQINA